MHTVRSSPKDESVVDEVTLSSTETEGKQQGKESTNLISSESESDSSSSSDSSESESESGDEFKKLEDKFYDMLKEFFEVAFTILVHKKGLQNNKEFISQRRFQLEVPVFWHEKSIEYVKEVSEKLVILMRRNVAEGAVFHVFMEDSFKKVPYVHQRIIFKPYGYFTPVNCTDPQQMEDILEVVQCELANGLQEIMSSSKLEKLECPWYSKWKISIGMNKEFMGCFKGTGIDYMGPFSDVSNSDFFPWTKRPRYSQAVKQGLLTQEQQDKVKMQHSKTVKKKSINKVSTSAEKRKEVKSKYTQEMNTGKLPQWQYFSSSSSDEDEKVVAQYSNRTPPENESEKESETKPDTFICPISNVRIAQSLMICIYSIRYTSILPIDEKMIEKGKKCETEAILEIKRQFPDDI